MANHQPPQGARFFDDLFRADQKSEPQAGEKSFRQRADIDHPAFVIERFQRRAGLVHVVRLELVVILDDDEVALACKLQKLHPPLKRHRDRGWKLVAWCNEHGVGFRRQRRRIEPMLIDRRQPHPVGAEREEIAHVREAGLLHHRHGGLAH